MNGVWVRGWIWTAQVNQRLAVWGGVRVGVQGGKPTQVKGRPGVGLLFRRFRWRALHGHPPKHEQGSVRGWCLTHSFWVWETRSRITKAHRAPLKLPCNVSFPIRNATVSGTWASFEDEFRKSIVGNPKSNHSGAQGTFPWFEEPLPITVAARGYFVRAKDSMSQYRVVLT